MPRNNIVEQVLHQIRLLVHTKSKILLAVSGGIDSMVMMYIASRIKNEFEFHVGHVSHNIRDSLDTQKDYEIVLDYAHELGFPFHHQNIWPTASPGNLEANAREQRYKALNNMLSGSFKVATAHHADDQLATIIMRLCQGRFLQGICTERIVSGQVPVIRPMLDIPKDQIQDLAVKRKIPYNYDITNDDTSLLRNRINKEILPLIKQIQSEHGKS